MSQSDEIRVFDALSFRIDNCDAKNNEIKRCKEGRRDYIRSSGDEIVKN